MRKTPFKMGERVAGMYAATNGGTVLDYSGVVVSVTVGGAQKYRIRFSNGREEITTAHPDFYFSMDGAYRAAAKWVEREQRHGEPLPTEATFEAAHKHHLVRPTWVEFRRTLWVLAHDRAAVE
jgi:hypothetical protein